jgi:hypothetical protein
MLVGLKALGKGCLKKYQLTVHYSLQLERMFFEWITASRQFSQSIGTITGKAMEGTIAHKTIHP